MTKSFVIGVAGGTGSGKTTVVLKIVEALGSGEVVVIQHDSYYRDRGHLPREERVHINYDHPHALDTDLCVNHLEQLIAGMAVKGPVYDFATHTRSLETIFVEPTSIIILEGILILADPKLRQLMDIKVFVDTDADTRFIRRLQRDITERGRTSESVIHQYMSTVKPMHLEFVEPSKRYADIIIPEGGYNEVAVDMLLTKLRSVIGREV
jgi:uridine kinase